MSRWTDDVRAFHVAGGAVPPGRLRWPSRERLDLAVELVREEVAETLIAIEARDLVEVADGIADSVWVLLRLALVLGVDIEAVWAEVARSNMAKFAPCSECEEGWVPAFSVGREKNLQLYGQDTERVDIGRTYCEACKGTGLTAQRRADGKVLKPEGWTPPDIAGVLGVTP